MCDVCEASCVFCVCVCGMFVYCLVCVLCLQNGVCACLCCRVKLLCVIVCVDHCAITGRHG